MATLLARIGNGERLLFDGAMGTMLQARGLQPGECPELWNVTHPDLVRAVAEAYLAAGSDVIETNTFGGNRFKLREYGLEDRVAESVQHTEQGSFLTLDPGTAQKIVAAVKGKVEQFMEMNYQPIVLTSPVIRRHVRRLMERFAPTLVVISHNELVSDIEIRSLGLVSTGDAN